MKKLIAVILTGIMIFSLTACAKTKTDNGGKAEAESSAIAEAESSVDIEEAEEPEVLPGGWSGEASAITDEVRELVEKAAADLVGAEYVPVAYIGRQIVNGTNHRILCKITPVVPDAKAHYAIVTIYEDLQGNAKISEILDSEATADEGGALGGWKATETPAVTEEAQAALDKAVESLVGAEYKAVALLATQLVSGTNYEMLCEVTAVAPGAEAHYAIVHVYQALDGSAKITDTFDFAAA